MDALGWAEPLPLLLTVVVLVVVVVEVQGVVRHPQRRETYWWDKDTDNLVDGCRVILKLERLGRLHVLNSLCVRLVSLRVS